MVGVPDATDLCIERDMLNQLDQALAVALVLSFIDAALLY
jgi:hypothetical protein